MWFHSSFECCYSMPSWTGDSLVALETTTPGSLSLPELSEIKAIVFLRYFPCPDSISGNGPPALLFFSHSWASTLSFSLFLFHPQDSALPGLPSATTRLIPPVFWPSAGRGVGGSQEDRSFLCTKHWQISSLLFKKNRSVA